MFQPGMVLDGTFQILGEIGAGGMGVIYRAYHLRLQKEVVVKKIKENFVGSLNARGEVDILKGLHHTYLPQIYDFLQFGSDVYTVMEYIQGYDLEYYSQKGWRFSEEQLLFWLGQLTEVLDYLHSRKPPIIHSDIKPANIMITNEGNVCLIDFNVSLSGKNEKLIGFSRNFASPEQYQIAVGINKKGKVDARSDIYSLGATFYYLMCGVLPQVEVRGTNIPLAYMPGLPYGEGFCCTVDRMMSADREKRYASAAKLQYALKHLEEQSRTYQKRKRIIQLAVIGGTAAVVLCVMTGCWLVWRQKTERLNARFSQLVLAYEQGDMEWVCQEGETLLYTKEYRSAIRKDKSLLGRVYGILGEAYMEKEDYQTARQYFEQAVMWDDVDTYYRDYAVTLARLGEYAQAESVLEEGVRKTDLKEDQVAYIQAEICWSEGDLAGAWDGFERALDDDLEDCSRSMLRQYGYLCYKYGEASAAEEREILWTRALEVYQELLNRQYAGFYDYYNMALVCEALGRYEESRDLLQRACGLFQEDYRVYVHLAVSSYELEVSRGQGPYDFREAEKYCQMAQELYGGEKDGNGDMEIVRTLEERLEAEGK